MYLKLKQSFWIVICLVTSMSTVTAQTKVVVIPLGDDVVPLANVITVAKKGGDFTDPLAAMNSITDSSASNPYLVVIAPGTYDIGTASLDLKPYVAVQGSGAKQTTILSSAIPAQDQYAIRLVGNSSLSGLRVRQDADIGGLVYGVIASGLGYAIHDVEIHVSNASSRGVGFSILDDNLPSTGIITNTHFLVPDEFDQGLGEIDTSVNNATLRLANCTFDVLLSGSAIGSLGLSFNSSLVVQSSAIYLHGEGGIGISNTDGDEQTYQGVFIQSDVDNVRGLFGSGSGFRPNFENSKIEFSGNGTIGVGTNNGRPSIRNSIIRAKTGFTSTSNTAVFSPTFNVDNSVISASKAVLLDNGFTLRINFHASRLDAFTILDPGTGTINAKCVNSSNKNFDPLSSSCS